jgi:predicted transglutaminase-like cysteine proteinase
MRKFTTVAAMMLALTSCNTAHPLVEAKKFPKAFHSYVERYPDQVKIHEGKRLTLAKLIEVNRKVNFQFRPEPETGDVWTISPAEKGDCDDFAATKKAMLIEQGYDSRNLMLATGWTKTNKEYHLVLVARVGGTLYVLDNTISHVRPWQHSNVRFENVQNPLDQVKWVKFDHLALLDLY